MRKLKALLVLGTNYLEGKGFLDPKREAEKVISEILDFKLTEFRLFLDLELSEEDWERSLIALKKRAKREPLQYIKGEVGFLNCSFLVNSHVLIPRPETEQLAEMVIREVKKEKNVMGKILLDLCSGSGCLGIAIKKNCPGLQVVLSDISSHAISLSKQNCLRNDVSCEFLVGNLLEPFKGRKAHFVVCNPPYIAEKDFDSLQDEVRLYEPQNALIGGKSGLDFYKRLSSSLPSFLYPSSKVWLEIGYNQGRDVSSLFKEPSWETVKLLQDYAQKDRFLFCQRNAKILPESIPD